MNEIIIYTDKESSRLEYISRQIFEGLLGLNLLFCYDKSEFLKSSGPKLSIAQEMVKDEAFFYCGPQIFEKNLSFTNSKELHYDIKKDFPCRHPLSLINFDVFSAAFFLISRYEEYNPSYPKDSFGRCLGTASYLYKCGLSDKPLINSWANHIGEILQNRFPNLELKKPNYQFLPTVDIDALFAFKGKPFLKNLAAILLRKPNALERWNYLLGKEKDPFDQLDHLADIFTERNLDFRFFFLMGNYGGPDTGNALQHKEFPAIIKNLETYDKLKIGIHFSYLSNQETHLRKQELENLNKVLSRKTNLNRQHFLALNIPKTYQEIYKEGIREDYSMSYADIPGFRAGIASPFYFYDLSEEKMMDIKIHPFAFMDGTFRKYMEMSPQESLAYMKRLCDQVKKEGACLQCLFHNESFSETYPWKEWSKVFMEFINYAQS